MKTIKTITVAIGLSVGTMLYTSPAAAQWVVVDPTNYIANFMTQLRAVQSNINEVQQIQQQLQQIKYMAENSKNLSGGDWGGAVDAIGRLGSVLQQGQAIAVSGKNFEQTFKAKFPGYIAGADYNATYADWNQTTLDSVMGAMRVANLQTSGIANERQALASLRSAASSTGGQKQALDAANQIALAQVEQMQQLRELMTAQLQAQGSYMAATEQEKAADRSKLDQSLQPARIDKTSDPSVMRIPTPSGRF
jgi:P-type conjugative transfer protein TrbJ